MLFIENQLTVVAQGITFGFKMMSILLCSLLLVVVNGGMIIDIDVRTPTPLIQVRGGPIIREISDQARTAFGIEDEQLKKSIVAYTKTKPNKVSVKIPEEKYGTYENNKDLMKVRTTIKARVVNMTNNCVRSGNEEFVENKITFKNDWEILGKLENDENIYHISSRDNITFKSGWWVNTSRHEDLSFIYPSNIEKIRGDIHFVQAIKCDVKIRLQYDATISGHVIAHYSSKGTKEHVQTYDLAKLQAAANLPTTIVNTETIYVSYYYKKTEKDGVDDYNYVNYDYNEYVYEDIEVE